MVIVRASANLWNYALHGRLPGEFHCCQVEGSPVLARGASMEQCSICLDSLDGGVVALAACGHRFQAFEARPARKRERPTEAKAPLKKQKWVEGAHQKKNGKWRSEMFPGREFDDLDAYRAAKKQRAARRAAWSAQCTNRGL